MKRVLKVFAFLSIALTALVIGCVNGLVLEDGSSDTQLNNISAVKNRSVLKTLAYTGGSMLFNPGDIKNSQLANGVIVATRAGKLFKKDLGNGHTACVDPVYSASFGYIEITEIDSTAVSFDYYVSNGWNYDEEKPVKQGSYILAAGQSVDLTGSGSPDLIYEVPTTKRAGAEKAMWLSVVNDPETTEKSFSFAILPDQYAGKAYPGGLVTINENGRYVVNKYNVNTSSRAAVKSISYGDYVIDNEKNTFQVYVGSSNFSSARAVDDSELKTMEVTDNENPETFYFQPEEFGVSYSIYKLFAELPASLVTVDYESMTVSDLCTELNRMLVRADLWKVVTDGKTTDAADDVRANVADVPFSGTFQTVVINRIVLAKMFSENCPSFSEFGTTFSEILPTFNLYLGDLPSEILVNNSNPAKGFLAGGKTGSAVTGMNDINKLYEGLPNIQEYINKYYETLQKQAEEAAAAATEDDSDLNPQYAEYCKKKNEILAEFDTLKFSYDMVNIAKSLIKSEIFRSILENANVSAKVGIGGDFEIVSGKFSVTVKVYALARFELTDTISYTFADSIFTEKEPFYIDTSDGVGISEEDMKAYGMSDSAIEKKIQEKDKALEKGLGIKHWYLSFKQSRRIGDVLEPTANAIRSEHFSKELCPPYPIVFTFDAAFDVLVKTTVTLDFSEGYIGGLYIAGVRLNTGITWEIKRFLGIPYWVDFDKYGYFSFIHDGAFYAGMKYKSFENLKVGGALEGMIAPVIDLRPGLGFGKEIGLAKGDLTLGVKLLASFPLTAKIAISGMPLNDNWDINVKSELQAEIFASLVADARAHASVLSFRKDWDWPLATITGIEVSLGKVKTDNGEIVEAEGPRIVE